MPFRVPIVNQVWLREKSLNLNTCQQKLPKLKCKEKKNPKDKQQTMRELYDNYKKYNLHAMGIPEDKKKRKRQKKYLKQQ